MSTQLYTRYTWPDAESSDSRIALGAHGHLEIEPGYLTLQLLQGCEVPMGSPGAAGLWRRLCAFAGEVGVLAISLVGRVAGRCKRRREAVAVSFETATASAYPCGCASSSALR